MIYQSIAWLVSIMQVLKHEFLSTLKFKRIQVQHCWWIAFLFTFSLSCGNAVGNYFSHHEAFSISGENYVRRYEEGGVASCRSYVIGYGEFFI